MTDAYLRQRPAAGRIRSTSMAADEIGEHPACAFVIRHPHLDSADLVRELASAGLDPQPYVTYSERNLVDIGPADVDKSTGVARAPLSRLGVDPAETIAFGDMPNDLPMFALCGYSVAMGNAHPDVRAAGTAVTACVHDDGVVRALRRLKVVRAARPARITPCRCPSDLDDLWPVSATLHDDDHTPLIAPTLARAIVAVVFCGFAGVALLWVVDLGASPSEFVLAVACLAGLLGLQYFYFGNPDTDLHSPRSYAVLVLQAGLVYLPLALYDQAWVSFSRRSWPPACCWSSGRGWPGPSSRPSWPERSVSSQAVVVAPVAMDVVYILVNSATAGLFVYGLTRLARLVAALHEARDELARTAVARERLRFAGHLHDLIGSCLSAIAPKGSGAAARAGQPGAARQELSEIRGIARQAVADAGALAHVYWGISPTDQPATLASMLAASNVDLRVDLDVGELPPPARTALSAVLREGVAAVLRHRDAQRCEILVRQQNGSVSVDIVNEAAGADVGLRQPVGGRIEGGRRDVRRYGSDGQRRLHVTLPVTARASQGPDETADRPRESVPEVATKLANWLVAAALVGLFVQAIIRMLWDTSVSWHIGVSAVCLSARWYSS